MAAEGKNKEFCVYICLTFLEHGGDVNYLEREKANAYKTMTLFFPLIKVFPVYNFRFFRVKYVQMWQ